jgi:hypothetical protein
MSVEVKAQFNAQPCFIARKYSVQQTISDLRKRLAKELNRPQKDFFSKCKNMLYGVASDPADLSEGSPKYSPLTDLNLALEIFEILNPGTFEKTLMGVFEPCAGDRLALNEALCAYLDLMKEDYRFTRLSHTMHDDIKAKKIMFNATFVEMFDHLQAYVRDFQTPSGEREALFAAYQDAYKNARSADKNLRPLAHEPPVSRLYFGGYTPWDR